MTALLAGSIVVGSGLFIGGSLQTAVPGKLYAIGGFDPDDTGMVPHRIYELNPDTGKATPLPGNFRSEPAGDGGIRPHSVHHHRSCERRGAHDGYMNSEALQRTITLGEAVYFSRSRQVLWHKGATSGLVQRVVELRIDDDQDCIWLRVEVTDGASCHVGYRSCFYRSVPAGLQAGQPLEFTETEKVFDPVAVYGDAPNPTRL